jgi:inorganic triphosphatase YgiF
MREIEAKFEGATLADTEAVLGLEELVGFHVVQQAQRHQTDYYYDTADAALRSAGASLRVRKLSDRLLMTYKGDRQQVSNDTGLQAVSRLEDEVEAAPEFTTAWSPEEPLPSVASPMPLIRARAISGDADLTMTAIIVTERRMRVFSKNAVEIEVAVDHTRATRGSDGRLVEFGEIEVELRSGEAEQLHHFCVALLQAVPGVTKLGRALS